MDAGTVARVVTSVVGGRRETRRGDCGFGLPLRRGYRGERPALKGHMRVGAPLRSPPFSLDIYLCLVQAQKNFGLEFY